MAGEATGGADATRARFLSFVMSLGAQGMADLGKVPQATTGKIERNLPGAVSIIALLDMLEAKTKGNLGKDEEGMLATTLSNLRMNYVDELEASRREADGKEGEKGKKDGDSAGDDVEGTGEKDAPDETGA